MRMRVGERRGKLARHWLDEIVEAIRQFHSQFDRALGGRGNGFDPNEVTMLLVVIATFLAILVGAALWERL
jgi:hypothetical protein